MGKTEVKGTRDQPSKAPQVNTSKQAHLEICSGPHTSTGIVEGPQNLSTAPWFWGGEGP